MFRIRAVTMITMMVILIQICLRGFDEPMIETLCKMAMSCGGTRSLSAANADFIIAASLDDDTAQHVKDLQ